MEQKDLLNDILASAAVARVSIPAACKRAGIAPSTFYRWKDGSAAAMDRIVAVRRAVDQLVQERSEMGRMA